MILQACSHCHRQYDITHVRPGEPVRCACDQVMTVAIPTEVTVRARKCSNCGGRVEGREATCGYCGSGLNELDLGATLCPRCYVRVEDGANHCQGCGVAIRPQALVPIRDGTHCPRCESRRGELRSRSLGESCVVECLGCEGLWVTTAAFEALCKRAQDRPDIRLTDVASLPVASSEPERKVRYIPCLACDELMLRKNFRYKGLPSHVILDYCKEHGVWLDKSELTRVVAFIQERANEPGPSGGFPRGDPLGAAPAYAALPRDPVEVGGLVGGYSVADPVGAVVAGALIELLGGLFD